MYCIMDTKQVILELRTQKGMSQDELAEKVFVSRQAVVEIKNDLIRTMGECRDVTDQYQTGRSARTKCIFATGTIIYEIICWIAIRI